jgi:AcrR family transcriptional regulator
MLKATAQKSSRAGTRERIVEAALQTLKTEGFAGSSARSIATRGGFNQALVFYYFGSVKELLLAALDATSEQRMTRYQSALDDVGSTADLLRVARELHEEDIESGHVTVLAEMIAGAINDAELAAAISGRMEPWIDFAERALARGLEGTPFAGMFPTRELARLLVSFYVGSDLMAVLDGDRSRDTGLFAIADRFLPFLNAQSNDA